jgi:hypothetical protein
LRRGGTLVTVQVADDLAVAAEAIFLKHRVDVAARRDKLADEGWARFDDHAPPYLDPKHQARLAGERSGSGL